MSVTTFKTSMIFWGMIAINFLLIIAAHEIFDIKSNMFLSVAKICVWPALTMSILSLSFLFYYRKQSSTVTMVDATNLDYARDIAKRLDEHREIVQSIEMHTTLLKTHPWHVGHLSTQDDYLMWLFFLRHGEWPNPDIHIGLNHKIPHYLVRARPDILGKCRHPSYPK